MRYQLDDPRLKAAIEADAAATAAAWPVTDEMRSRLAGLFASLPPVAPAPTSRRAARRQKARKAA